PLLVLVDRASPRTNRQPPESRMRLRVWRDSEHQRVLLRDRRSPRQGEVTRGAYVVSRPAMGTIVTIQVSDGGANRRDRAETTAAVERAFGWFDEIEACCSRFDPSSELRRLALEAGQPVAVSAMLFEAVRFALAVAEETGGAF